MASVGAGSRDLAGGNVGGVAAMSLVAIELAVVYILGGMPTPLYPSYRQAFGFSPLVITLIYAVYVVGTVGGMFFFGRLSDQIGRKPVVLAGLAVAVLSALAFLFATSTPWLFAARVLNGASVALVSGASTAWTIELHPRQDKSVSTQVAIGASSAGLGIGSLLSGLLAQYGPAPLRLSYVVELGLLLAAAVVTLLPTRTVENPKPLREASVRPRLGVPRKLRGEFVGPAVAAFATFSVLGFYAALIPSVLGEVLHISSRAVAGAVVAAVFLISAAAIATMPHRKPKSEMVAGLLVLLPGIGLLVLAEHLRSMDLLLLGTAVTGLASGLGYRGGLELVNAIAPDDQRAELVSSYLIVCYAAISLPVIGVGIVSTFAGVVTADTIFAGVVAALALAALGFELWPRRGAGG